jgi:hypothetical protein
VSKKLKTFTVEIKRTTVEGVSFEVEAQDEDEAREKAFAKLEDGEDEVDYDLIDDEKEVTDVYLTK